MSTVAPAHAGPTADRALALRPDAAAERARRAARTRRRLWLVGAVLVAALGFLVFKALTSAIVYFKTANEAVASRSELGSSTFQLEGVVVPGSVRRTAGTTLDFTVESGGVKVPVENSGAPPQLFQQNIPVVLVGHFVGSGDLFSSNEILVKHSNAYIAAHPSRVAGPTGKVVR